MEEDPSLLTPEEARVLGCLMEKETTTPEYYPMTLNSLCAACNQRSNRDPVVAWDERTVEAALDSLRRRRMAVMMHMSGSRVPKYRHSLDEVYGNLDPAMKAVLCELLVRNIQTPGELRTRTERLHPMAELSQVEAAVQRLENYGTGPMVTILPPGGGRRVKAVAHLLCGPVSNAGAASAPENSASPSSREIPPPADWKADMEAEIAALKQETASLREIVDRLKVLLD
ncbi:MAG: YceH family protein [Verrucomicrobiota bacterium]